MPVDPGGGSRRSELVQSLVSTPLGVFLLVLIGYAAGSKLALLLAEQSGLDAVFFIPAGITVAALLRMPRDQWWLVLVAAGLAEATVDLLEGYSFGQLVGFVAANVTE